MSKNNYATSSRNTNSKAIKKFHIRLTNSEYEHIFSQARKRSWTMSKYVVEKLFNQSNTKIKISNDELQQLIRILSIINNELKAIGRNINQIAYKANLEHKYLEEKRLLEYVNQLEKTIKKIENSVEKIK